MGGSGSGRQGGRATVESALRLDINALTRAGAIQPGAQVGGEMKFRLDDDDELAIEFESSATGPETTGFCLSANLYKGEPAIRCALGRRDRKHEKVHDG
jgi:predicted lysophospholipase L1 biosynthesis ABC-type transport system permease subunit